jgi:hypothetical protein
VIMTNTFRFIYAAALATLGEGLRKLTESI